MKQAVLFLIALTVATAVQAQDRSRAPTPQGLRGKSMESCKADAQKFCAAKALKQECLVTNWTKISSDCQDALATPMRGGGG
jgi:hypothetical protein